MGYEEFKNEIENLIKLKKQREEMIEKKIEIERILNGKQDTNNNPTIRRVAA
jgi:hypothetical protein